MAQSPWPTIAVERAALADDLSTLTEAQWTTPSLCEGWTVHQLLGHMVATAHMTKLGFISKFAGSGFNFDKMADKEVAEQTRSGPAVTLAALRDARDLTTSPPGPVDSWLGETLIHSEDIRRPLGIKHAYPPEAVVRVLDFYKKSNLIVGAKKRVDGLALRADDVGWSTGDGPEVNGPAMSLAMAMTGRRVALDDLSGGGVAELQSRMA